VSDLTAEKLAKIYIKIRDRRRDLAKEDEDLKEKLDLISGQLLEICKEQGASTIRTEYGTISRRVDTNYWTSDWDSFWEFVKKNDAFSLVQRRINVTNMAQFLEENPEEHPPGLNADSRYSIVITKR